MPEVSFRFSSLYAWWYSYAWKPMKMAPSRIVANRNSAVRARWPARRAWWAIVRVTPEVSSSAVLMVGIGNGPMVLNCSTVPAGPTLPQWPE